MEFISKVKNKKLSGQTREIIANIINFMEREGEANAPLKDFKKVQERVALSTGLSLRNVQCIKREMKAIEDGEKGMFTTPNKKRRKTAPKTDLDDFDLGVLRRYIINFYVTDKKVPTLRRIHRKFAEENNYNGSRESIRKVMRKIGFRWIKTKSNRKLLMEKPDIQQKRLNYLRNLKRYREENRPVVYMDETYIHSSHTHKKSWSDNTNEGLRQPVSKGQRLVIVNAGNENGFIPNAYLKFKSKTHKGDYHNDMNFINYKKWIEEMLLPNLPPRSVIVIDNAPYHNVQIEKSPNMSSRKDEMKEWLRKRSIVFNDKMLKAELYEIIRVHKPHFKTYAIDKLLNDKGHDVLRLPPYHPDLNPIELVWASMKQFVADRNVEYKLNATEKLCDEFFSTFSLNEWKTRCEHARKAEKFFMDKEPLLDDVLDTFIINVGDDSDSDSENFDSSDSDISGIEPL